MSEMFVGNKPEAAQPEGGIAVCYDRRWECGYVSGSVSNFNKKKRKEFLGVGLSSCEV